MAKGNPSLCRELDKMRQYVLRYACNKPILHWQV
jgi:hypothetical protein